MKKHLIFSLMACIIQLGCGVNKEGWSMDGMDNVKQENKTEHGGAYYRACMNNVSSGQFTKEDLDEIAETLSQYPVQGPQGKYDIFLDETVIEGMIKTIENKGFNCTSVKAENFKVFLEVLKPEINTMSRTTLPFIKYFIRDIQRYLRG